MAALPFVIVLGMYGTALGGNSTAVLSKMQWRGEPPYSATTYSVSKDADTLCSLRGLVQVSNYPECKAAMQGYVSSCGCDFGDAVGVSAPSYAGTPGCSLHWPKQRGKGAWSFSSNTRGQGLAGYTPVCRVAATNNSTLRCDLLGKIRPTRTAVSSVFCPTLVDSSLVLILVASLCGIWVIIGISLGTNSRFQACVAYCCGCAAVEEEEEQPSMEAGLSVGVSMTKGSLDEGEAPDEGERVLSATVWEPAALANGRAYEVNRLTQETRWVEG